MINNVHGENGLDQRSDCTVIIYLERLPFMWYCDYMWFWGQEWLLTAASKLDDILMFVWKKMYIFRTIIAESLILCCILIPSSGLPLFFIHSSDFALKRFHFRCVFATVLSQKGHWRADAALELRMYQQAISCQYERHWKRSVVVFQLCFSAVLFSFLPSSEPLRVSVPQIWRRERVQAHGRVEVVLLR